MFIFPVPISSYASEPSVFFFLCKSSVQLVGILDSSNRSLCAQAGKNFQIRELRLLIVKLVGLMLFTAGIKKDPSPTAIVYKSKNLYPRTILFKGSFSALSTEVVGTVEIFNHG